MYVYADLCSGGAEAVYILNTSLHVATQLQFLLNPCLHVAIYTAAVPPEHMSACSYTASVPPEHMSACIYTAAVPPEHIYKSTCTQVQLNSFMLECAFSHKNPIQPSHTSSELITNRKSHLVLTLRIVTKTLHASCWW